MKKTALLLILPIILGLLASSCALIENEDSFSEPLLSVPPREETVSVGSENESEAETIPSEYSDCGIPLAERYPEFGDTGRNVWDMKVFEGYLYIACGDYDRNEGPCEVWRMELESGEWELTGEVNDEQISHFEVINGQLTIPGTDPRSSWDYGSYYVFDGKSWSEKRNLPGGVHVFDMLEYKNMIFAGLGTVKGDSAVVMSDDGGETYSQVDMYMDGKKLDTENEEFNRVYDLFTVGETLFALYYSDDVPSSVFRYDGEKFVFERSWSYRLRYSGFWYMPVGDKANLASELYLAAGVLYRVTEAAEIAYVPIDNVNRVWDTLVFENELYVLCDKATPDGYEVIVVKSGNGIDFSVCAEFESSIPARSFAFDGSTFWFGLGTLADSDENSGRILSLEVE